MRERRNQEKLHKLGKEGVCKFFDKSGSRKTITGGRNNRRKKEK